MVVEAKIDRFEGEIQDLRKVQEKHEEKITKLSNDVMSFQLHGTQEIMDEIEQRNHRRTNVIVRGIPELNSGTIDERKEHDEEQVKEIISKLKLQHIDVNSTTRIGKIRGVDRPMRVRLNDDTAKTKIDRKSVV